MCLFAPLRSPTHSLTTILEPAYYIVGGLVFTPYTGPLYDEVVKNNFRKMVVSTHLKGLGDEFKEQEGDELILMSRILPHDCNEGYQIFADRVPALTKVNDQKIRSMMDLIRICEASTSPFLTFSLSPPNGVGENKVVISRAEANEACKEILELNSIPHRMSKQYR